MAEWTPRANTLYRCVCVGGGGGRGCMYVYVCVCACVRPCVSVCVCKRDGERRRGREGGGEEGEVGKRGEIEVGWGEFGDLQYREDHPDGRVDASE